MSGLSTKKLTSTLDSTKRERENIPIAKFSFVKAQQENVHGKYFFKF
jgi:hypothetical protein